MKFIGILIAIVVCAAAIRLWNISTVPPGLTWDEASLGYNAYSILKTGRDEYGQLLPLNLKSFGDYKPALYAYFTVPFVAVLGLNETAVRLPAVLFGTGLVMIVYFLILRLLEGELNFSESQKKWMALLSSLMLAISPLAIQFSRPAFETGVALFFNALATLLFLKGLKNSRFFILTAIFFGLSLFIYQSSRLFVPLLIGGLFLIYRQQFKFDRYLQLSSLILAVFVLFLVVLMKGPGQTDRLATMNFFAYPRLPKQISEIISEDHLNQNSLKFNFLHGEWFAYTRGLFERYLIYFSPKMLFVDGDYNQRNRVPDLGVLSYISLFFVPLGLAFFLKLKQKGAKLLLFWLLLAPLPAVLSRDLINMIRALNLALPLAGLEGVGVFWLIMKLGTYGRKISYLAVIAIGVLFLGSFVIFSDRYFTHLSYEYSPYWLYGYKESMTDIYNLQQSKKYDKIIISDSFGQPYIYYLFYTKYSPHDFQKQAVLEQPTVDVGTIRKIDNIEFRHVYWPTDHSLKNSLFMGTFEELPDKDIIGFNDCKILKEIKFLDGQPALRIVETK